MARTQLTHKGWFWICPIYLSPAQPDCPVEARVAWLEPLFSACAIAEQIRITLTSLLRPDWTPTFAFLITGEVRR